MRCPACGAFYQECSARCPECGAIQNDNPVEPFQQTKSEQAGVFEEARSPQNGQQVLVTPRTSRSLIEFPGVTRSPMPQWRKELGERVREVHERKAREAFLEAAGTEGLFSEIESNATPVLELLPQAETPPMNPIVVAALQRIERAHSQPSGNTAMATVATALVYEEQAELDELDLAPVDAPTVVSKPERVHNLAVVPTPTLMTPDIPQQPRKPRRLIDDQNDPALNYLDSIPTLTVEIRESRSAPFYMRIPAALVDIIFIGLFSAPFLALTRLTNLAWLNPRVIAFAAGAFLLVGFLYLTVSIAFTGRTIGMKLFSLRVVDARTGLIPTGGQSVGRALIYMLSLALGGVALLYTLINHERQTAHDHFTRTAVIRL